MFFNVHLVSIYAKEYASVVYLHYYHGRDVPYNNLRKYSYIRNLIVCRIWINDIIKNILGRTLSVRNCSKGLSGLI